MNRKITKTESVLLIERDVEFREIKSHTPEEHGNGIRVYGDVLQLRAVSPLNHGGKPRNLIATASFLDKSEVRALIERLQEMEKTLR